MQDAMFLPPMALRCMCNAICQQKDLRPQCREQLLEACAIIVEAAQIAFFSRRYVAYLESILLVL